MTVPDPDDVETPADDRPRLVRFALGERSFLVGVESVHEVLVAGSCTRLPGSAPAILGVTSVRGRIVAVVDPRPLLHPGTLPAGRGWLLVVRTPDGPVGLLVDRVDRVVPAEPEQHTDRADQAIGRPVVIATAVVDGDRIAVLDPVALVAVAIAAIAAVDVDDVDDVDADGPDRVPQAAGSMPEVAPR